MDAADHVAGSFRDPSGRVYRRNDKIYRTVTSSAVDDFAAVERSGLLEALVNEGKLVDWRDGGADEPELAALPGVRRVLEHPSWISFPTPTNGRSAR
jgi:hypothetical protein